MVTSLHEFRCIARHWPEVRRHLAEARRAVPCAAAVAALGQLRPGAPWARVGAIIDADERETRARHAAACTKPLGVRAILNRDPFSRPHEPKKGPAPLCHCSGAGGHGARHRRAFREVIRRHTDAARACTDPLERAVRGIGFLPGASAPPVLDLRDLSARTFMSSGERVVLCSS